MEETQVRCPQCGSTQIAPVRKDYDMGCGCLGLILFGWIGLLLGLLGGGNVDMVCANCGGRTTFRDHRGASVGSSTTAGNRTTYRDSAGRVTGSATTSGNVTTYRDASGKITGSATRTGNRIIYRDASGRTTGTQVNQ